jgi:hypothetical protein
MYALRPHAERDPAPRVALTTRGHRRLIGRSQRVIHKSSGGSRYADRTSPHDLETVTRVAKVTFDGTSVAVLQVGALTCNLDLVTRAVSGCH